MSPAGTFSSAELKPDSARRDFPRPVRSYAAGDEDDLRHLLARLAHRLGLDQDKLDEIARRAPAELLSFEPRPLVPVTCEVYPIRRGRRPAGCSGWSADLLRPWAAASNVWITVAAV